MHRTDSRPVEKVADLDRRVERLELGRDAFLDRVRVRNDKRRDRSLRVDYG